MSSWTRLNEKSSSGDESYSRRLPRLLVLVKVLYLSLQPVAPGKLLAQPVVGLQLFVLPPQSRQATCCKNNMATCQIEVAKVPLSTTCCRYIFPSHGQNGASTARSVHIDFFISVSFTRDGVAKWVVEKQRLKSFDHFRLKSVFQLFIRYIKYRYKENHTQIKSWLFR